VAPGDLERILKGLAVGQDERILSGPRGGNEDAVVVRFPPGMALVQTVDFLTPVVDDPFQFGQIAAANSLSDVYAVGGEPLSAMNVCCFPARSMPPEVLGAILKGGLSKIHEAGAVLCGGHSVEDTEIKYGLSVSGVIDPDKIATNRGLKPGDTLVLTKPIGTGVLATAVKAGRPGADKLEALLLQWCARLNRGGAAVIRELGLKAATDVTGFGLGGHLLEMAQSSGVCAELDLAAVPFFPEALELAALGLLPGGSVCNLNHYMPRARRAPGLDDLRVALTFDAQTSGGLILGVPQDKLADAQAMLEASGDLAVCIGRVQQCPQHGGPALLLS
jgi:selenide,water dikinase